MAQEKEEQGAGSGVGMQTATNKPGANYQK